jgi:nicotinamidase-related amidase
MATVREGNKPVLLIVDVQIGLVRGTWDAARIVKNVSLAVERARAAHVPVLWVQHADHDLPLGNPEWNLVPELVPAAGEALIHKRFESSFEETSLEKELATRAATHIVLAGTSTNWCIRATAYGAIERGYDLTLLKDAHTTRPIELDNGLVIDAANMVRDLNVAMTWLNYPGRKNGTATAEAVNFAVPGGTR